MLASIGMSTFALPATAAPTPPEGPSSAVAQARENLADHSKAALTSPRDTFRTLKVLTDEDGSSHVRMQRLYDGLPVSGGQTIVHNGPQGGFDGVTTTIEQPLKLKTDPGISKKRAQNTAKKEFQGSIEKTGEPNLVVDVSGEPRLAWDTTVKGTKKDGTPSRLHVLVDAQNAEVLGARDEVNAAEGRGTGTYNGQVTFTTTQSGSGYRMVDPNSGDGATRNADNGNQVYTDSDNAWSDSEAVDVHYGVGKTYEYFATTHGFEGPAGNGNGIPRNVHVNGYDYCNAFYNGSSINFGDCNGNPLTGIDVAAHEFSHGVTDNTAGLNYNNYDAGGLNESTSDIFGTLVEFAANSPGDEPDYLIGETVGDVFGGEALRFMYDPNRDGKSFNCYSQGRNTDPHYSSGIGNHFFYLLVNGSQPAGYPASPTCDGSTIEQGIGNDKGGAIWFRALTRYMGPSETYPGAADATLQAATDLYGECSAEYQQVQQAWAGVDVPGVGKTCDDPPAPGKPVAEFSADCSATEPACSFDASGSTDEDGSIASYAWTFGDGNTGDGATPSHTYTDPGTYEVTLTVTDDDGNTDTTTQTVTAGNPPDSEKPQATFTTQCDWQAGCTFDASASTDDTGIATYTWNFGDGTTGEGETAQHTYTSGGTFTVTLTVTDQAGQTGTTSRSLQCYDFGDSALCFPN